MNDYEKAFVDKFSFLPKLSHEERKNFLSSSIFCNYLAGTVLANDKSFRCGVAFVISGNIRSYKVSQNGREISLYNTKAGEICIMTISYFLEKEPDPVPFSIKVMQDSVIAILPFDVFRYHYCNSPYLQQFIFKDTLSKFYGLINLIECLTFKSVTERIWDYMMEMTEGGKKPLYITHSELASALGTSREVVTRRLHQLENNGLIKIMRGKLIMLKPEKRFKGLSA